MNYVFILFDSEGKIVSAQVFTPDARRSPAEYAYYIGLDIVVCDSVFRSSGKFPNTVGLCAVALGPYSSAEQAALTASTVKAASLIVDMALRLVRTVVNSARATGNG